MKRFLHIIIISLSALSLIQCISSNHGRSSKYDMLLSDALMLHTDGYYKSALERIDKAIEKKPTRWEAFYLKGYFQYLTNDFTGAVDSFMDVVERLPYNDSLSILNTTLPYDDFASIFGWSIIRRDEAKETEGTYKAATIMFEKGLLSSPESLNSLEGLALCYTELKDYRKAEQYAKMVMAIDKSEGYFRMAYLNLAKGQVQDALRDFEKSIELNPDNPYAIFNLAVLLQESDREHAIELFTRAGALGHQEAQEWLENNMK